MSRPGELIAAAATILRGADVPSPEFDAATLLAHVLGTTRGRLAAVEEVADDAAAEFRDLVARRASRVPLQHLVGSTGFRYVDVAVGPGVFTPRPETELLAGWAVDRAREVSVRSTTERPVVVDLCTGSGAIALAVATEVPAAEVHAVELDPRAFTWAQRNLAGRGVDLREGDMADAFAELAGTVDVVVCNPPYIPLTEYEGVDRETREHDPTLALFSGQDGLDAIRVLERSASRLLRAGGVVGCEHSDLQGVAAPAVFVGSGRWVDVRDHDDLAGRPRFVTARRA